MIVYKVVRKEDGKLKSAVARREPSITSGPIANLTYSPNKTTKPRFGKLFAFDTLITAQCFWGGREVWEAEAPDAKPITLVAADGFGCLKRFKEFWSGKVVDVRLMKAPAGTVICSELMLIRKIE